MKKVILLLIVILLTSCGARKVDVSKETKDSVAVENTKQIDSIKEDTKTEIKYDTETCEIEVMPIDSTKEFTFNGKKYFNARIKIKNKKDNTLYVNTKKVDQKSIKQANKVVKTKQTSKQKHIDRKQFNYLWILLIIFVLIVVYNLYKRYKNLYL